MYKTIIFDFFGVFCPDPYKAWLTNHGLENKGAIAKLNEAADRGDMALEQYFTSLGKQSGQTSEAVAAEQTAAIKIDQTVISLLGQLKAGYRLALISNAPSDFIRDIITEYQLETYFDYMAISAELRMIKPSPEIFLHTLDELGADPEETIFTDDNPKNTAAVEKLGIKGIVFTDADSFRHELKVLGISI